MTPGTQIKHTVRFSVREPVKFPMMMSWGSALIVFRMLCAAAANDNQPQAKTDAV